MAENITIARPYAEAAFQLALGTNALGPWQQALDRMAAVATDPLMVDCINNPSLLPAQLSQVFLEVAGNSFSAEQCNFVRVLADNERLTVLPEIRDLFVELKNGHEGVREAHVTSAFPLDDGALGKLVGQLESRFRCKLQPRLTVDPGLIGGVKIAVGDEVIDASVRGKLAAMETALKN